jgi:hypothetical protein
MRRIATGAACALLLGGIGVALVACGSGEDSSTTTTTTTSAGKPGGAGGKRAGGGGPGAPPKSRPAHPRDRHFDRPPGSRLRSTYPARIIGHGLASSGPIQPEELWPVRNGWRVSVRRAARASADPRSATGRSSSVAPTASPERCTWTTTRSASAETGLRAAAGRPVKLLCP